MGPIILNDILNPVSTVPIQPPRYPCTYTLFKAKVDGQAPAHRIHLFVPRALHGLRNVNPLTKQENSTYGWTESNYACGMTLV
jgi:hypothetical protein